VRWRCSGEHIVCRQRTTNAFERKFTHRLDGDSFFHRRENTRANQDLTGLGQRLGLFQIARVEAFGEPAVDRSEKIGAPRSACPGLARAAPLNFQARLRALLRGADAIVVSEMNENWTYRRLFDHVIGLNKQRGRYLDPERLGSLSVNHIITGVVLIERDSVWRLRAMCA
jgi:hypothetical protein